MYVPFDCSLVSIDLHTPMIRLDALEKYPCPPLPRLSEHRGRKRQGTVGSLCCPGHSRRDRDDADCGG